MREEHRYKYGKRAWDQEYKFIHHREEFRAEDKFEVQSREADEKAATDALVFGFTGMRSFLCVSEVISKPFCRPTLTHTHTFFLSSVVYVFNVIFATQSLHCTTHSVRYCV